MFRTDHLRVLRLNLRITEAFGPIDGQIDLLLDFAGREWCNRHHLRAASVVGIRYQVPEWAPSQGHTDWLLAMEQWAGQLTKLGLFVEVTLHEAEFRPFLTDPGSRQATVELVLPSHSSYGRSVARFSPYGEERWYFPEKGDPEGYDEVAPQSQESLCEAYQPSREGLLEALRDRE
jgi:hypothetical protein